MDRELVLTVLAIVLTGATFQLHETDRGALALVGERIDFETRIRRLLAPPPPDDPAPSSALQLVLTATPALISVAVAGALWGETLVRTVFRVLP